MLIEKVTWHLQRAHASQLIGAFVATTALIVGVLVALEQSMLAAAVGAVQVVGFAVVWHWRTSLAAHPPEISGLAARGELLGSDAFWIRVWLGHGRSISRASATVTAELAEGPQRLELLVSSVEQVLGPWTIVAKHPQGGEVKRLTAQFHVSCGTNRWLVSETFEPETIKAGRFAAPLEAGRPSKWCNQQWHEVITGPPADP